MWSHPVAHRPEGEWLKVAPGIRTLSFDIECAGRRGVFPVPQEDPVIQIASTIKSQGPAVPPVRSIFTLGTCAPIAGADVRSFELEADMLRAWRDYVLEADPDILTGYNIVGFDIPEWGHCGYRKFYARDRRPEYVEQPPQVLGCANGVFAPHVVGASLAGAAA